jgi:DNA-binding CsgD family transcriptional regulator
MSKGDPETLEPPPPSRETLARVAWTMALVRDLAATPAAGTRRVRRLLAALLDRHRASSACARVETHANGDGEATAIVVALGWTSAAEVARGRHRLGARAGDFFVDAVPLDGRRTARLELFRPDAPPFDARESAWLAVTHAGCAWAYGEPDVPRLAPIRRIEGLSPRDRETLEHLLDGASEKQIAARIGRSPHTVHTRVKRIYRRFGVTSRPELLARCLGEGASAS